MYQTLHGLVLPFLKRLHVTAAQLTWTSLFFSVMASLAYMVSSVLAGFLLLTGGLFDILDGLLARETGTASARGAFLDSTLDRYGEAFVFIGVWSCLHQYPEYSGIGTLAVITALFGSNMVSYTRARGEALGISFTRGFFTRDERLLILAAGSLADPLASGFILLITVVVLAIGANLAAVYRFVKIIHSLTAAPVRDSQSQKGHQ